MKINRSILFEWGLPFEDSPEDGVKVLRRTYAGKSRWSTQYELIVEIKGKIYQTFYSVGDGDSGETPWEHHYAVDFDEVEPVEKVVTDYVKVRVRKASDV